MDAKFFTSGAEFRDWLARHHATAPELLVGFNKKDSGRGGLTYAEALDEALCFGWIDGVRKSAGPACYTIRFTPRRPGSVWSQVNMRHVERLSRAGRMQPAGVKAFESRDPAKCGVYSFERRMDAFPEPLEKIFRREPAAWDFWQRQPLGYRRAIMAWVSTAKRDDTQHRRLDCVIRNSAAGRRVDLLAPMRVP